MNNIDAIILAGGQGTRLQKVVRDRPKPMAEINGRPFLDMLLAYIARFGFTRFILCLGYMSKFIEDYYKDKTNKFKILFSHEDHPLGTGGAVKNAEKMIQNDSFLVFNGDSFCPVNLNQFADFHYQRDALLSIVLTESNETKDFGNITINDSNRILRFEEKSSRSGKCFINAGIYLFSREVLSMIPQGSKCSLEYDLFPKLVGEGFYGFITNEKLIDIGIPDRYEEAKRYLRRTNSKS